MKQNKELNLGDILQLAQIIVLVVSGCWVLYQFLTFTSLSQRFQLENYKLENERTKLENERTKLDSKLKSNELEYASRIKELEVQKNKQEAFLREIEIKYSDSKISLEILQAQEYTTTKEHELRKEIASIYDRIIDLSKDYIKVKIDYAANQTWDNYNNAMMLKAVLDLQKDNFLNLEAKLAKLEKREVRKFQIEFPPPAPPSAPSSVTIQITP